MKCLAAIIVLACLESRGSPVLAQVQDEDVSAFAVSIPAIMTKVPVGPTALIYSERNAGLAQKLAVRTGKKIDPESNRLVCHESSVSHVNVCSIKDAASLVALGSVHFSAETASVTFDIIFPDRFGALEHSLYRINLKRVGGLWVVVDVTQFGMS